MVSPTWRHGDSNGVHSPYAGLNLMAILLVGSNASLPVEHAFVPLFAHGHSDDELAAVANFVNGFSVSTVGPQQKESGLIRGCAPHNDP